MTSVIATAIHSTPLGEQAFAQLRSALVVGRLLPGQRLSLRSLCADFGTSVTPVREAVNRLTAIAALEGDGHHAVRVPVLSLADRDELRRMRSALELLALRDRVQAGLDIARMRELHVSLIGHVSQSDPVTFATALLAVRSSLFNCGPESILGTMIDRVWCRFGPCFTQSLSSPSVRCRVVIDYTAIVTAIGQGDVAAAELALDREIQASSEAFSESWIEPRPSSPSLAPEFGSEPGRAHLAMGGR